LLKYGKLRQKITPASYGLSPSTRKQGAAAPSARRSLLAALLLKKGKGLFFYIGEQPFLFELSKKPSHCQDNEELAVGQENSTQKQII
jgi:hypothetical protein